MRALLPLRSKYTIGSLQEDLALTLDFDARNAEGDMHQSNVSHPEELWPRDDH